MIRILLVALVTIISALPELTIAQERQYLHSAYLAAGGAATLNEIPSWRMREKETLRTRIMELPDSIKQDLIDEADRSLEQAWPQILLSDYREFQENG